MYISYTYNCPKITFAITTFIFILSNYLSYMMFKSEFDNNYAYALYSFWFRFIALVVTYFTRKSVKHMIVLTFGRVIKCMCSITDENENDTPNDNIDLNYCCCTTNFNVC